MKRAASAEKEEDDKENMEMMIKGKETKERGEMDLKEREEMGAIYLLSNLDSPSALAWTLLQPLSPLLRLGDAF